MKYPACYTVGNIFFIKIGDDFQIEITPKYLRASSTGVYSAMVWTKEEILSKYPDVKACKDLQSIGEVWKRNP